MPNPPDDPIERLRIFQEAFYKIFINFFSGGTYNNILLGLLSNMNEGIKQSKTVFEQLDKGLTGVNASIAQLNSIIERADASSTSFATSLNRLTKFGLIITIIGTFAGIVISVINLITAHDTLKTSQLQFDIENRPRIGLESFEKLSGVDSELNLKGNSGTVLSILDQTIKNFGNLPAYFEISSPADQNLVCVSSKKNYIMPQQGIHILCERPIGAIREGDKNLCDAFLRQQITINYGFNEKDLKFQTVLNVRPEDRPALPSLIKKIEMSAPKGCDGNGKGIIFEWYIANAT